MSKIPAEEKYWLRGAVAPQFFGIRDDEILYFDKINRHEGRFYRQKGDSSEILFEIGEEQGIVGPAGERYILSMADKTVLTSIDSFGNPEKSIELQGVFFDFKINETGHYVCLGNMDAQTLIKILNPEGKELGVIKPGKILFGSTIYLKGDFIYLGAIDLSDKYKLLKLNYMGNIIEAWDVGVNSRGRIISKVLIYGEYILMLISGSIDSVAILDTRDSGIREIGARSLGMKNIIDFNIYGDSIYMLNEKFMNRYNIEKLISADGKPVIWREDKASGGLYLKYAAYMQGFKEQIPSSYAAALAIYIFLFYYTRKTVGSLAGGLKPFLAEFYIFWIVHYMTAALKNIFMISKKDKRIEYLLEASGGNNTPDLGIAAYIGIVIFSTVSMMEFPLLEPAIPLTVSLAAFITFWSMNKIALKMAKDTGEDLAVELLWEDNRQIKEYINQIVLNLRRKHSERLCIEITASGDINEGFMNRWARSRKNIIRENMIINVRENKIEAILDLSKRDLKYSRASILMDYICFIKHRADIKEIQVLYPD